MPFESLSFRYSFTIPNFPERWLPLIYLYDADLPLFPIYYFHATSTQIPAGQRPGLADRVFGYIEKLNSFNGNLAEIQIVTNKDLNSLVNDMYRLLAENEIKERLGFNNPVMYNDIANAFLPPLDSANAILRELWHKVIANNYDNRLPFGRIWDEVLGLSRFVASFNSPSGRKGELIQTHYFCTKFGEPIQTANGIACIDFYLLPTVKELTDTTNPLNLFPKYSDLITFAGIFCQNNCSLLRVGNLMISRFNNPGGGRLDTDKLNDLLQAATIPPRLRPSAIECYNTFDKGPQRTVIFIMMLWDTRNNRINPGSLNNVSLGSIYDLLKGSYQSPKVIQIYTQQCFGNIAAIPIDIWIETFLKWPLNLEGRLPRIGKFPYLFSHSIALGKVERLLWITAQARKVHSSACDDAVWCIKYASGKVTRGANPLACKACHQTIRQVCPAYAEIQSKTAVFNIAAGVNQFSIITSAGNNTTPGQHFESCEGKSIYDHIFDDFSTKDMPAAFATYPSPDHMGAPITVDAFMNLY